MRVLLFAASLRSASRFNAQADQRLGPSRQLTDEKLSTRLDALLAAFIRFASALARA